MFDHLMTCRRLLTAATLAARRPMPATIAHAQHVVVIVNGEPITALDIEQRSKLTQLSTQKPPARQDVIDELINEKLKVREAKKFGFEVSDAEVDSALPRWRAACGLRRAADPTAGQIRHQHRHAQAPHPRRHRVAANRARTIRDDPAGRREGYPHGDGFEVRRQARASTTRCARSCSWSRPGRRRPSSTGASAKRKPCAAASRAARRALPSPALSRTWRSASRSSAARPTFRWSCARCSTASRSAG